MTLNTAMQLGPMLARVLILEHIVFHLPPANPSADVPSFTIRVEIVVDSEVVWESDEASGVTWDEGIFQAKAVDQFICGDVQVGISHCFGAWCTASMNRQVKRLLWQIRVYGMDMSKLGELGSSGALSPTASSDDGSSVFSSQLEKLIARSVLRHFL